MSISNNSTIANNNSVEARETISCVNDTVKAGSTHRARNLTKFLKPIVHESMNSFESPDSKLSNKFLTGMDESASPN